MKHKFGDFIMSMHLEILVSKLNHTFHFRSGTVSCKFMLVPLLEHDTWDKKDAVPLKLINSCQLVPDVCFIYIIKPWKFEI